MPPKPVTLVHVSDIHFGAEDSAALDVFRDFVAHIQPDAVIVAGDITQSGKAREFRAARDWFDKLGVKLIIAPGNHDTPALHLPARMTAPFARYAKYMADDDSVGRLIELRGGQVRLSAINTARGVQGRINWADGVIDLDDLDNALNLLAGGPADAWRILVCHHPLREPGHSLISVDTRRGGEALRRCATAHVDAILTGHIHDAFAHPLHAHRRHLVQMGSGTLSTRTRGTRPSFCVVVVDGQHLVQEIVTINASGLELHRNYDSDTHGPGILAAGRR